MPQVQRLLASPRSRPTRKGPRSPICALRPRRWRLAWWLRRRPACSRANQTRAPRSKRRPRTRVQRPGRVPRPRQRRANTANPRLERLQSGLARPPVPLILNAARLATDTNASRRATDTGGMRTGSESDGTVPSIGILDTTHDLAVPRRAPDLWIFPIVHSHSFIAQYSLVSNTVHVLYLRTMSIVLPCTNSPINY